MVHTGFLTGNLVLDLAILAWFLAQLMKTGIYMILNRSLDLGRMVGSGGMPSSHSAFVCAVAASVGQLCGWQDPLFAVATVMAMVVMYDACNVRRAAGEQAQVLNYIIEHWNEMSPTMMGRELKELLGHTPLQVLMGAILGTAIGLIGPMVR